MVIDMTHNPFGVGQALAERLEWLVPAGGHTYSKGRDQFPKHVPGLIEKGERAWLFDSDDNRLVDYGMGLRSVTLGHCFPPVLEAVREQLEKGSNFTRPSVMELVLAEEIVDLIPAAEMVKFAKNGSDVTAAAVRLARAYTARKYVAICGEDPFYSFYDWFIGSTPCDSGIPREVAELTLKFHYNDIASLELLIAKHPGDIAAVILEPLSDRFQPEDDFLDRLRALTEREGIVLIFDEIITGFRYDLRGAQNLVGVTPDLCTFGKGCANGFSANFLCGRREIMELGGLNHDKPRVFLLSGTHGAETHGLAAALATIRYMRDNPVIEHLWTYGRRMMDEFNALSEHVGLGGKISMVGYPCSPRLQVLGEDGKPSFELLTIYQTHMIAQGVLAPWLAISYSHDEETFGITTRAFRVALQACRDALDHPPLGRHYDGEPVKPVWRRFNADFGRHD